MQNYLHQFWQLHPTLLYGLFTLLGVQCGLGISPYPLYVAAIFFLLPQNCFRFALSIFLFGCAFLYGTIAFQEPSISSNPINGKALFSITSIHKSKSPFSKRVYYKGTLRSFHNENKTQIAKNLPILIFGNGLNDGIYQSEGTLTKTKRGGWLLKLSQQHAPILIQKKWPIAKWRRDWKQTLSNWIQEKVPNPRAFFFLSGLATGEFMDPEMSWELSRFGLQHIMAISGFHFSLVALMISSLLRLFIPRKFAATCVILSLSTYFLFLGPTASILRAWVMIFIFFLGSIVHKKSLALNSLGVALIALSLYDPFMTFRAGFLFSFIITASILLFFPLFNSLLDLFFKKRPLIEIVKMDLLDQHGYLAASWLRQGLALTCAVHLAAIPLVLFFFQKFPVLSLFYNLFFPFFVSFSLFLLLLSLLIPPLATTLCLFNNYWTSAILGLVYNIPSSIDIYWQVPEIPPLFLIGYFIALFGVGIVGKMKRTHPLHGELSLA